MYSRLDLTKKKTNGYLVFIRHGPYPQRKESRSQGAATMGCHYEGADPDARGPMQMHDTICTHSCV